VLAAMKLVCCNDSPAVLSTTAAIWFDGNWFCCFLRHIIKPPHATTNRTVIVVTKPNVGTLMLPLSSLPMSPSISSKTSAGDIDVGNKVGWSAVSIFDVDAAEHFDTSVGKLAVQHDSASQKIVNTP
jgi:hypothetical protein